MTTAKYFYKDADISDLNTRTDANSISVPANSYQGFPSQYRPSTSSNFPEYKSKVSNPFPLRYEIGNADVSNYCTAYYQEYSNSDKLTVNNSAFKHISSYGWGGGGGGGGGGGALKQKSNGNGAHKGGDGGDGGPGAYVGVVGYPLSTTTTTINFTVGGGGAKGEGGNDYTKGNEAEDGKNGSYGGSTTLNIGGSTILTAPGGQGGGAGGGGNSYNYGGDGTSRGTPTGSVNVNGYTSVTSTQPAADWPGQKSGFGGYGGEGASNNYGYKSGASGSPGYIRIYFLSN